MRTESTSSYPVSIFIAGDCYRARLHCALFCDDVGLCVTVTPTTYVYTGGQEPGVIVGLINYPRFPADPHDITDKATRLADYLREALGQESYSIQTPDRTIWRSWRAADITTPERPHLMTDSPTATEGPVETDALTFEITGPDADDFVWLVTKGGNEALNLGRSADVIEKFSQWLGSIDAEENGVVHIKRMS